MQFSQGHLLDLHQKTSFLSLIFQVNEVYFFHFINLLKMHLHLNQCLLFGLLVFQKVFAELVPLHSQNQTILKVLNHFQVLKYILMLDLNIFFYLLGLQKEDKRIYTLHKSRKLPQKNNRNIYKIKISQQTIACSKSS